MARTSVSSPAIFSVILLAVLLPAQAQQRSRHTLSRTPDGHPDFQGIWTNATLTLLERPAALAAKPTLTDAEAVAVEQQAIAAINAATGAERRGRDQSQDDSCGGPDPAPDCGRTLARVNGLKRTSLIADPPDGHIPPFRPEARAAAEARLQPPTRFTSIKDRPLPERCLLGFGPGAGPPMMPGFYNNNYQIVQTPEYLMILAEMVHDVRIVRIAAPNRPHTHPPAAVRLWLGDSIGHWEGDTLVVDTANFTAQTPFHGSSPDLHVVERFTRAGATAFLYSATLDDPSTFSQPWTLEYPFVATPGPVYEYSCHEGNADPIRDILLGNH